MPIENHMSFKDHFSGHAADYGQFRPCYPDELFEYLALLCEARNLAWDCATGNGQAAIGLASRFDRVVASDASRQQVDNADARDNIEYIVAKAEVGPLGDASADLICVAQAVHWFDMDLFYKEVRRVLKPGGVLAVWSYQLATIEPAVDAIVEEYYEDIVGDYWPEERAHVMRGYKDIPFPFSQITNPDFLMSVDWNLGQLMGYLGTWSATRRYIVDNSLDPLTLISESLTGVWGDESITRSVRWPLTVLCAKV